MPDAAYFRKQAQTCRRLARTLTADDARAQLLKMAQDYDTQAAKLDGESSPG